MSIGTSESITVCAGETGATFMLVLQVWTQPLHLNIIVIIFLSEKAYEIFWAGKFMLQLIIKRQHYE